MHVLFIHVGVCYLHEDRGAAGRTRTPSTMTLYTGIVQEGSKRARALGYPTVNIVYTGSETGVYAGNVLHDGTAYPAAAFADPERGVLEAHILDHHADLYGEIVSIELLEKIRDSRTFENDDALKAAIAADVAKIRASGRK